MRLSPHGPARGVLGYEFLTGGWSDGGGRLEVVAHEQACVDVGVDLMSVVPATIHRQAISEGPNIFVALTP